jgi:hypothetical protein
MPLASNKYLVGGKIVFGQFEKLVFSQEHSLALILTNETKPVKKLLWYKLEKVDTVLFLIIVDLYMAYSNPSLY